MPTMTKPRRVDLASWQEGRVPPDVQRACLFIFTHKRCTWAQIAEHMGFDHLPREEWRRKMRRYRRWGVAWTLNQSGSTRIVAEVRPFLGQR